MVEHQVVGLIPQVAVGLLRSSHDDDGLLLIFMNSVSHSRQASRHNNNDGPIHPYPVNRSSRLDKITYSCGARGLEWAKITDLYSGE